MRSDAQPVFEDRIVAPSSDEPLPSPAADHAATAPIYTGTLKWFDQTRGFGFMVCDAADVGDIMVHFSVLQAHGRRCLPEGARLECRAVARPRGLQATEVLAIDLTHAVETPGRRPSGDRVDPVALAGAAGPFEAVTLKWFNRLKGYGFLLRERDAVDIFVHMETLRKAGVIDVEADLRLRARIVDGRKGPLAVEVEQVPSCA